MNWMTLVKRLVAGLFVLGVILTFTTGSPVPLWHLETLDDPVRVISVSKTHLSLEDGRQIKIPHLKQLPNEVELFRTAMANGVEMRDDGHVIGLMWFDRNCGNDPVVWRHLRVDLTELGGAIQPEGLDSELLSQDTIDQLMEYERIDQSRPSRSHVRLHLNVYDFLCLRKVREVLDYAQDLRTRK